MKAPIKPGSEAGKVQEGGSLGNIDEQRGHPGRGTGGTSLKPEESGNMSESNHDGGGETSPAPAGNRAAGEEKNLYDRLADKDAEPTG